jgi:D-beta-D-heptose 7-phosphate kinase/D-beta-D-heptose 1-phosphate adenosyltransferase
MNILVIGDVMLDVQYESEILRNAPEADIPIYNVVNTTYKLGGACNVAKNLHSLKTIVTIMGVIGNDEMGGKILSMLKEDNIYYDFIKTPTRHTTQKHRHIINNKIVSRHDIETTEYINERIESDLMANFYEYMEENTPDAIVFSDYNKGILTPDICQKIIMFSNERNIKTFVDPKTKDVYKYRNCFFFKPNLLETEAITGCSENSEMINVINTIIKPEITLITLGKDGMWLNHSTIQTGINHEKKIDVVDVTGAGDIVLAVFTHTYLTTKNILYSAEFANYIAGLSVKTMGNFIISPELLIQCKILRTKIITCDDLILNRSLINNIFGNKKIVFTNGCFDILHSAHIQLLKYAKSLGDVLIVGLNSDESIRRLKGDSRPINPLGDRVEILKEFDFIDLIVVFEQDTPLNLLNFLRPYYLVKGGDYKKEEIIGAEYANEVVLFDYKNGKSSTNIIRRVLGK